MLKIKQVPTILLILILMITTAASAATTGSITISGVIAQTLSLVVRASDGSSSLNFGTEAKDLVVATITESSNTTGGYKVSLTSANSGQLKNGALGGIPYTAKYDGKSIALKADGQYVTSQGSASSVVNVSRDFSISYGVQNPASLMAGSYSDTLTFTISAN